MLHEHCTDHPLGCHRSRIPKKTIFEEMVQVLVFCCAYERIADASSGSTLRRRQNEWIELGVMERLRKICLDANDRLIGLKLSEVAVDASGIPLSAVSAPANRHDSPLLVPTLEATTSKALGTLPEEMNTAVFETDRLLRDTATQEWKG